VKKETFSNKHFLELGRFIQGNYGIKMPDSKKLMVEARLRRRMRIIGCHSFDQYLDYVFSPDGKMNELVHMIDSITTNKTDFFREPIHFDILNTRILPKITTSSMFAQTPVLHVWSSACSTGEEPYTIAMVIQEYAAQNSSFEFSVLASDLSTRVLKKASRGVYPEEQINDIPLRLREKYLLKSKDRSLGLVQINEQLRQAVNFRRINLMDHDFGIQEKMHIIFCRNVLIYFQKDDQERLINKFHNQLKRGGFLLIGHSETILGMDVPFVPIMPTVYQKR
jgi:chemotaxis protein methyltransferase CheR